MYVRSIPMSQVFIERKHGRHREVSFSENAFNTWIRRRPMGKIQTPLATVVSSVGVVFSEAQLARPLGISIESLAQAGHQPVSVKRFIVEPKAGTFGEVQYDCVNNRQRFDSRLL